MALFTGKGDDGSTYFFGSKERFGKDTPLAEALGTLDELNSLLGFVRTRIKGLTLRIGSQTRTLSSVIEEVQQNLFIIQAELAGAEKEIAEEKVQTMEKMINEIEKNLPPIKTFFVPGANETSALLDFARTVARRAERRVVALAVRPLTERSHRSSPAKFTLAYLNRLSSLLYALARLRAQAAGKVERRPHYR